VYIVIPEKNYRLFYVGAIHELPLYEYL